MVNQVKTLFFLILLSVLFLALGYFLGGRIGLIIGFSVALITNFISYWYSDKIVLSLHHAREVRGSDPHGLNEMVARLCQRMRLPTPRIYIVPDASPNAFATGRNPYHSAIAITQGLMAALTYEELEGVIGHELSHIKDRDTLVSSIAAVLASSIMLIAGIAKWSVIFGGSRGGSDDGRGGGAFEILMMAIVAPIAAVIIQMAVSRSREYLADAHGAAACGNPESLAGALRKIQTLSSGTVMRSARPAFAHLYIVNPLSGRALLNLFNTHPPIEDRISRLLAIRRQS